jgi:hypothetical protein
MIGHARHYGNYVWFGGYPTTSAYEQACAERGTDLRGKPLKDAEVITIHEERPQPSVSFFTPSTDPDHEMP